MGLTIPTFCPIFKVLFDNGSLANEGPTFSLGPSKLNKAKHEALKSAYRRAVMEKQELELQELNARKNYLERRLRLAVGLTLAAVLICWLIRTTFDNGWANILLVPAIIFGARALVLHGEHHQTVNAWSALRRHTKETNALFETLNKGTAKHVVDQLRVREVVKERQTTSVHPEQWLPAHTGLCRSRWVIDISKYDSPGLWEALGTWLYFQIKAGLGDDAYLAIVEALALSGLTKQQQKSRITLICRRHQHDNMMEKIEKCQGLHLAHILALELTRKALCGLGHPKPEEKLVANH